MKTGNRNLTFFAITGEGEAQRLAEAGRREGLRRGRTAEIREAGQRPEGEVRLQRLSGCRVQELSRDMFTSGRL